jgi:hypothetical protein
VNLAPTLPAADLVTLDRVVCCYPELEPLMRQSADKARCYYALSFPHDGWYMRAHTWWQNDRRRRAGNPFRTFVHPVAQIRALLQQGGFEIRRARRTLAWEEPGLRPTRALLTDRRSVGRRRELGRSRLNGVKYSEEQPVGAADPETGLADQVERLAVPMTAEQLRVGLGPPGLIARRPDTVAAAVLEQQDSSVRATDSGHFSQCLHGIGEGASR